MKEAEILKRKLEETAREINTIKQVKLYVETEKQEYGKDNTKELELLKKQIKTLEQLMDIIQARIDLTNDQKRYSKKEVRYYVEKLIDLYMSDDWSDGLWDAWTIIEEEM